MQCFIDKSLNQKTAISEYFNRCLCTSVPSQKICLYTKQWALFLYATKYTKPKINKQIVNHNANIKFERRKKLSITVIWSTDKKKSVDIPEIWFYNYKFRNAIYNRKWMFHTRIIHSNQCDIIIVTRVNYHQNTTWRHQKC